MIKNRKVIETPQNPTRHRIVAAATVVAAILTSRYVQAKRQVRSTA